MPALNSDNDLGDNNQSYFHIFNSAVDKLDLYDDDQDYETFINFLEDYLSPREQTENLKVDFSVNGRTYKGIPHQPKNYHSKIDLIAYNLQPDHFHLIVHEIVEGSLEKFMRSLSTRYVIYYNKKHQRSGSLFRGPYKSLKLHNDAQLLYLTRYLHRESLINDTKNKSNHYSSYESYLRSEGSSWIKSTGVINYLASLGNEYLNGTKGYKNFVEVHKLQQKEKELVNEIAIDPKIDGAFDSDFKNNEPASHEQTRPKPSTTKTSQRARMKMSEFVGISTLVFIFLFTVGVQNVHTSTKNSSIATNDSPSPTSQVSGAETSYELPETPSPTSQSTKKENDQAKTKDNASISSSEGSTRFIEIKIEDSTSSASIRSNPSIDSEIITNAKAGDIFELTGEDESKNWYQITLDNGTNGYVWSEYAVVKEGDLMDEQSTMDPGP